MSTAPRETGPEEPRPAVETPEPARPQAPAGAGRRPAPPPSDVPEIGGPAGPEPTRYGDWERGGRCIDF